MSATETLSPADQWTQINYPSFLSAVLAQVKKIEKQLQSVTCVADRITFSLNNVPCAYAVTENRVWATVEVGTDDGGKPQVEIYVPYQWVMA